MRRTFLVAAAPVAVVVATLASRGGALPALAAASEVNRAVVVVDLGNGDVRSACVRFRQQSITGIDLLRAARMDPVVQTYSGEGGAVCKLCGVGCNAGSGCLTCQAPRYWQYWRSDGGSGAYTYSQSAASRTAVTDGDVEGWSWSGEEDPPPFLTVAEVCSGPNVYDYEPDASQPQPMSTTTTTTTTGAAPTSTARSSPSTTSPVLVATTSRPRGAASTTIAVPAAADVATTVPPAITETTAAPSAAGEDEDEQAAPPAQQPAGAPRSSLPGLVAFAAVLAAVLGWTARLRLARGRDAAS